MKEFYPCKQDTSSSQNKASSSFIYFSYFSVLPPFTTTENKLRRLDWASSEIRQLALRYAYANAKLCRLVEQIDAGWERGYKEQTEWSLSRLEQARQPELGPMPTAPHSDGHQSTQGCKV